MESPLLFERRGPVALFTLNRPERRNAIDPALSAAMNEQMSAFESDFELKVAVIAAAGSRAFCAGADLKAIAAGKLHEITDLKPGGFAGVTEPFVTKPLIAAVNGAALAGGCEIALACDLVIAAEHATFGLPEVSRGIIAGAGGLQRIGRRIPPVHALELALTGRPMTAARAEKVGLVNRVVDSDAVLPCALDLAEQIARNAPIAVRESKAVIQTALRSTEEDAWLRAALAWQTVLATRDAAEGPRAFAEGREPVWEGR